METVETVETKEMTETVETKEHIPYCKWEVYNNNCTLSSVISFTSEEYWEEIKFSDTVLRTSIKEKFCPDVFISEDISPQIIALLLRWNINTLNFPKNNSVSILEFIFEHDEEYCKEILKYFRINNFFGTTETLVELFYLFTSLFRKNSCFMLEDCSSLTYCEILNKGYSKLHEDICGLSDIHEVILIWKVLLPYDLGIIQFITHYTNIKLLSKGIASEQSLSSHSLYSLNKLQQQDIVKCYLYLCKYSQKGPSSMYCMITKLIEDKQMEHLIPLISKCQRIPCGTFQEQIREKIDEFLINDLCSIVMEYLYICNYDKCASEVGMIFPSHIVSREHKYTYYMNNIRYYSFVGRKVNAGALWYDYITDQEILVQSSSLGFDILNWNSREHLIRNLKDTLEMVLR